ncbi:MAG: DNA-binding response regulator, NarL/FixJ family, contains and domain [Phycisphaerales bacterium]|nr:DNA-binding response regulator, NarL/FixJ family, contains and domain [Phycisphaerales bacterium]
MGHRKNLKRKESRPRFVAPAIPAEEWDRVVNHLSISPRQADVARCLIRAMSNGEIAAKLRITSRTVHAHLSTMYARLNVADRMELAILICLTLRQGGGRN